jgi:hypothetical protein
MSIPYEFYSRNGYPGNSGGILIIDVLWSPLLPG